MIISRALAAVALMFALPAVAGAQVTLDLINEYPATAISGEADTYFAAAVKRHSGERIINRVRRPGRVKRHIDSASRGRRPELSKLVPVLR